MGTRFRSPSSEPTQLNSRRPSGLQEQTKIKRDKMIKKAEKEIRESYKKYAEKTDIPIHQGKKINERRESLEDTLKDRFDIKDRHIFGSFSKGTMVGPLNKDSDTDVMFVLNKEEHGRWINQRNGPKNCLQSIKRAIENDPKYANSKVEIDRNVVRVQYHDFAIEVVPAFEDSRGGYLIPDTSGRQSWIRTNPRTYKKGFETIDKTHGGKLKETVRAAKDWNERNGKPVSSFHMENMVYQHFKDRPVDGSPSDEHARDFFKNLPTYIYGPTYEPVYGEQVDDYLTWDKRTEAIRKAKRAQKHVERAERLKNQGKTEESKEELKKVHGKKFK